MKAHHCFAWILGLATNENRRILWRQSVRKHHRAGWRAGMDQLEHIALLAQRKKLAALFLWQESEHRVLEHNRERGLPRGVIFCEKISVDHRGFSQGTR